MRITEIEIKNFRAFYGTHRIDLHKSEKNLLIYGENGSGKSSLYLALKLFLESGVAGYNHRFEDHQNIFLTDDDGYIKLYLRTDPQSKQSAYEWSKTVRETNDPLIIEASKTKGFIDYKALLETHYLPPRQENVNVFDLLVNNLLADTINDITTRSFADDWTDLLQAPRPYRNATRKIAALDEQIKNFGISSYRLTLSPAVLPFLKAAFSPSRNTPRRNVPKACGFCRSLYFQPVSARYSGR